MKDGSNNADSDFPSAASSRHASNTSNEDQPCHDDSDHDAPHDDIYSGHSNRLTMTKLKISCIFKKKLQKADQNESLW